MKPSLRRWQGEAALRAVVERALDEEGKTAPAVEVLRDSPRRRLVVLRPGGGRTILLKQFRCGSGRHPLRERWKARLGRAPASREWRALVRLHAAGLPVPQPLALGTLSNGDCVLAMEFVGGVLSSTALLAARGAARHALLAALGQLVARVHRAGWVHGDLHAGNVLIDGIRPVLLDWQHARQTRRGRARRRDLGWLDRSFWRQLSRADRMRLRLAALGLRRPLDAAGQRALRAVGAAAERRAREHAASRTRRSLRPGRLYARLVAEGGRGMRHRAVEAEAVERALALHRDALTRRDEQLLKDDARSRISAVVAQGRRMVVKEGPWRGLARALADTVRGSPGRRAWRGGHGLLARGVGSALPLAFLEWRRWGVPVRSLVVLEDVRPATPASAALELGFGDPDAVLEALARLTVTLHRGGAQHGDLKGTHVLLQRTADGIESRLIDLEGVRFPRHLPERGRLRALAELNASLPDAFPASARRRAFDRYARALPFRRGRERALAAVVAASLARRHRWNGTGCSLAHSASSKPTSRARA